MLEKVAHIGDIPTTNLQPVTGINRDGTVALATAVTRADKAGTKAKILIVQSRMGASTDAEGG